MNATTRAYPRTLNEAFGPYTSQVIDDNNQAYDIVDKVIIGVSLACILGVLVAMWLGVL